MSSTNRGAVRAVADAYYTSDKDAERLVSWLGIRPGDRCLEPSVGGGAFARAMGRRGGNVRGIDLNPHAAGFADCNGDTWCGDFLTCVEWEPPPLWVVGNPPYDAAEAHIRRALEVTGQHVAFLLRLAMLESKTRIPLWHDHPPRKVWVLQRRPSFSGAMPKSGAKVGTDSAAYGFFHWDLEYQGVPMLGWI